MPIPHRCVFEHRNTARPTCLVTLWSHVLPIILQIVMHGQLALERSQWLYLTITHILLFYQACTSYSFSFPFTEEALISCQLSIVQGNSCGSLDSSRHQQPSVGSFWIFREYEIIYSPILYWQCDKCVIPRRSRISHPLNSSTDYCTSVEGYMWIFWRAVYFRRITLYCAYTYSSNHGGLLETLKSWSRDLEPPFWLLTWIT